MGYLRSERLKKSVVKILTSAREWFIAIPLLIGLTILAGAAWLGGKPNPNAGYDIDL